MSSGKRRSRRKANARPRPIVITGISGNLGRLLTRKLHTENPIIGIDARPFDGKPKDVAHYQVDARRRKAEDIFRKRDIRALIHLGLVHRPIPGRPTYREWNVRGTIKLLDYCQKYDVPKVVLISTAYVYGAEPSNSNFLTEDAPLLGAEDYPEMRALIEWDMYAQSFFWKHPHVETVILRPVHILGPNVRNAPSNYLRLRHPPKLLGFDPMVQVLHEDDLIQAILLGLEPGRRGVFNVVGPGELPLSSVLKELGRSPIPIPHPMAKPVLSQLWRLGLVNFPPGELPHLQYQCMVDGTRAKEILGFRPRHTLKETIRSLLF
jgi:UDP-glucose 4-epimerase